MNKTKTKNDAYKIREFVNQCYVGNMRRGQLYNSKARDMFDYSHGFKLCQAQTIP